MKLHRLELAGFGPFRERQTVDFDAFDRDGLFLISGRTGAGKSSILDGVCFALFGTVPRFGGSGDRRLRSDHCALTDPTEVILELSLGDTRWRITRAPEYERPAKRGGGMTSAPARAELEERVGDVWIGRAKGPRDVGLLLHEALGSLSADQFQQVVLLAQNQFSRFLLAGVRERQDLLRTLFGTSRFERYRDDLKERGRRAQQRVADARTRAETLLEMADRLIRDSGLGDDDAEGDGSPDVPGDGSRSVDGLEDRRARAGRALQRATYRVETRGIARSQAEETAKRAATAAERARADAAVLGELETTRARLGVLDAAEPAMTRERTRLDRARAAAVLRAPLDAAVRAESELIDARTAVRLAEEEWSRGGAAAAVSDAVTVAADPAIERPAGDIAEDDRAPGDARTIEADTAVERLTGEIARLRVADRQESDLDAAATRLGALSTSIADRVEALERLDALLESVPAELARLDAALVIARERAGRGDDLRARRRVAAARATAAREAARRRHDLARCESEALDRHAEAAEAGSAVTDLMRRRLAGYAGELAAGLSDGIPCAVCGSTAHPSPAAASDDPVTDDDLQRAQERRDAAETAARAAADRTAAARTALAEAIGRSDGLTVDGADGELSAIEDALAGAEAAVAEVERLVAERAQRDTEAERHRAERTAIAAQVAADREEAARLDALVTRLRADVDAARGPFETVAGRLAELRSRRDAAIALRDALAAYRERERAHARAVADRDAHIAASDFDDPADASAALLDDATCRAMERRIAAHTADRAAVRARALELELAVVEIVAVDVSVAEAASHDADAARAAAIRAERDASAAEQQLRELLDRLDAEHDETRELIDEAAVVTRLADTVAGRAPNTLGMDLETFVLAAELEEIVRAGNLRLSEMSSGRYTLHHSDARVSRGASGLSIEVLDAHTGRLRSPQSLSGGETFLASLALALGLADVVTSRAGGLRLDTLFVDEGFGSLDPETLELAMRTLDELRAGGRTVGLISHVEAMKEQIPAQLVVTATPEGPSRIAVR